MIEALADALAQSIRSSTMDTARSQQTKDRLVGISDLGSCREYLRLLLTGAEMEDPPDAEEALGLAAFVGAAVGDRVEEAMVQRPGWRRQVPIVCRLDDGKMVQGHADLVHAHAVVDVKTKNGLQRVRKEGPELHQAVQISAYLIGALQQGEVEPEAVGVLYFIDRSGKDEKPHIWTVDRHEAERYLAVAVERLEDVIYAIHHGEEAERDQPEQWCRMACPFFNVCRGAVTDVGGLLHEKYLRATDSFLQGKAMKKVGEGLMQESKEALAGVNGSTGTHIVRWIHVNAHGGYERLDIRPLPKGKL